MAEPKLRFQATPLPPPAGREIERHGFPADGTAADQLAWAVGYAILAPSSHNSQPWLFRVEGDTLELRTDRSRALPVVDPDNRELVISCGAALFHLRIALRKVGFHTEVELLPDPRDGDLLARVRLGERQLPEMDEKWLFWAIRTRRTNRRRFLDKPIPGDLLEALRQSATAEGASLAILQEHDERKALARLVAAADRKQIAESSFRQELASWLHPDRSEAPDGMPGAAVGIPHVATHMGPLIVRRFDWGRGRAAHDRQLALGSPALAVVTTDGDEPLDWLAAGQALARVLLRAMAQDVVASFLNQPVEVDELRAEVAALTGGGVPQLVLRLGYAPQVVPTPRRPVEAVLVKRA